MSPETRRTAIWLAALLVGAALVGVGVALGARSLVLLASAAGLVPAALCALLAALHLNVLVREADEARDHAALEPGRLFDDDNRFEDAARSRRQFERWIIPVACLLLVAAELALARWLATGRVLAWSLALDAEVAGARPEQRLFLAAVAAGLAFGCFCAGRVAAALAVDRAAPPLRPAGDWLLAVSAVASAGAATLLLVADGGVADVVFARVVAALLAVAALDALVTLGLEGFRARSAGPRREVYEGRLLGLLVRPRGLVGNLAATLDYQFGWKLSGTDFYRVAGRAAAPLALFQLASLWLLSGLIFLAPHEVGLHARLGRPAARPVLGPGFHLIAPWPIDRVERFPARQAQTVRVAAPASTDGRVVEELFLVASADVAEGDAPLSLISAEFEVTYDIADAVAWRRRFAEPEVLIESIVRRAATAELAARELMAVLSTGRGELLAALARRVQAACDEAGMGVAVRGVTAARLGPPASLVAAFDGVGAAEEQQQALVFGAEAQAASRVADGEVAAATALGAARGAAARERAAAAGRRSWFAGALLAARAAPGPYRLARRVDAVRESLASREKTVTTVPADRLTVDLREKARPDILDVPLAPPKEQGDER